MQRRQARDGRRCCLGSWAVPGRLLLLSSGQWEATEGDTKIAVNKSQGEAGSEGS